MKELKLFIYLIFSCMFLAGCTAKEEEDILEPGNLISLKISVAMPEMTGTSTGRTVEDYYDPNGASISNNEKMQSLRIVIVRPDGIVEHNRFINFYGHAYDWYGYEEFKVVRGEKKTVYLFVNEKSTQYYLPNASDASNFKEVILGANADGDSNFIRIGEKFPTGDLERLLVKTEKNDEVMNDRPLPMSESHSIPAMTQDTEMTLFVARAAVKFTYVIKNNDPDHRNLVFSKLTIDKMSRMEYYMPKNTVYSFDKNTLPQGEEFYEIESYDVPNVANNDYYIFSRNVGDVQVDFGKEVAVDSFYLLEGKYDVDNNPETENYQTTVTLNGVDLTGYYNVSKQLPRNTHVVVYIEVGKDYELNCVVDVRPYTEVVLEPGFGQ